MRKIYALLLAANLTGFSACDLINPSEPVPTYFRIDSLQFGRGVMLGSTSRKVTNIWVYFNNAPVGNFDLPARFPVIAEQPGQLTVLPGIDYNGLTGVPLVYPLYIGDTLTFSPEPGATKSFTPSIGYNPKAYLRYNERFDGSNTFTWYGGDTTTMQIVGGTEAFEGGGSGKIVLQTGVDSAIFVGGRIDVLPRGVDAYIELDYITEVPLRIGMLSRLKNGGYDYIEQRIGLSPRGTWNHVYIGIKEFLAAHEGDYYKVYIRADKAEGQSSGSAWIDNVKVISY